MQSSLSCSPLCLPLFPSIILLCRESSLDKMVQFKGWSKIGKKMLHKSLNIACKVVIKKKSIPYFGVDYPMPCHSMHIV